MLKKMYKGMVNSPEAFLIEPLASGGNIMYISTDVIFPEIPTLAVIGKDQNAETIKVLAKRPDGGFDIERAFEGIAKDWKRAEAVARNFTNYDYQTLIDNIETVEGNVKIVEDNIETVEGNVKIVEDNIETVEGNIKTVEDNIAELATVMDARVAHIEEGSELTVVSSDPEADGVYKTVTWSRRDGTTYAKSTLSGDPYNRLTMAYYDKAGTGVDKTIAWALTVDENGVVNRKELI